MRMIRTKLSMIFIIFMFLLVLSGILLNALFLERFYIYKNKGVFIAAENRIRQEYMANPGNIPDFINFIDRVEGISCIITDKNLKVRYLSFPQKPSSDGVQLPSEIEQLIVNNSESLGTSYIYSVIEKPNDQAPKLVYISRMEDGGYVVLRKSLKGIDESVSIANQFYVFCGTVMVLLGSICIFIFSKTVTKPIIEISSIAEDISNLDFNRRVIYKSRDEIGSLGESVNRMSEKLKESINNLKQDVERRKQLVRNISHELKTPIGIIKGYAEGLKFGVAEDRDKTQRYCTVIAEECNRMDSMIRELLNLSMMESGMFQIKVKEFDVNDLVRNISERFEAVLVEKGVSLDLNLQDGLFLSADYELIDRVVSNYITNAINHTEGSKHITVTTEAKEHGIRISVLNTGKSIPEGELKNIWDVFYKIDKARSREYGGHGLGLSIVKLIAELHGGAVGVENTEEGVIFYINLP